MKKHLALVTALITILTFAACTAQNDAPAPAQDSAIASSDSLDEVSETIFKTLTFGNVTIDLPDVFHEVTEQNGMYVSAGPASSITVTPVMEMDLLPSEWDEDLARESLEMFYGQTYTNLDLAAYGGEVTINGNTAIYYAFTGKNTEGILRLVHAVRLYNADQTAQYIVLLVQTDGDEFFTSDIIDTIINSITLSADAQHLTAEVEG